MEVYKGDLANGECEQCTCKDGMLINCHHIFHCVLNDSSCNSYSKKPGQCCPTCERGIVGKLTVSEVLWVNLLLARLTVNPRNELGDLKEIYSISRIVKGIILPDLSL